VDYGPQTTFRRITRKRRGCLDLHTVETVKELETAALTSTPTASTDLAGSKLPELPIKPLIIIEPSKSWVPLNLRELWAYRELLYFLTWRDLKVRYKQTVLGVIWVVVQPLLGTIIFSIFLGKLARVPSDGIPYPIFVYVGLLSWTFFSAAVTNSGNSLVGSAHLITKVFFPRLIIPVAAVAVRLIDLAISFVILIGMMLYYGISVTRQILLLLLLVPLITLLALGIGMWTSALNVKYRDIGVAIPVLMQLWMFASPVVYPLSLVPSQWQRIYALNPLVGYMEGFRYAILGGQLDLVAVSTSIVITLALLVYSAYAFRRMEKEFADIV
jgi:lipopolysaccharide transport system permease protein